MSKLLLQYLVFHGSDFCILTEHGPSLVTQFQVEDIVSNQKGQVEKNVKNDETLAHKSNTRPSWSIWYEVRETNEAIHHQHDHSLVEVLNLVQPFILHANGASSNDGRKDDVEHKSGNLEKQGLPSKHAQNTYHETS